MWLFPYHKYYITSSSKPDVMINRLKESINPKIKRYRLLPKFYDIQPEKYFDGKFSGNIFKIHRSITGRNSFLPMIKCEIEKNDGGTQISIRMQLHPIVLMFCLLIVIIGTMHTSSIDHIKFVYDPVPFVIILAMYLLSLFMFKYEAKIDEIMLLKTLYGEIED